MEGHYVLAGNVVDTDNEIKIGGVLSAGSDILQ